MKPDSDTGSFSGLYFGGSYATSYLGSSGKNQKSVMQQEVTEELEFQDI